MKIKDAIVNVQVRTLEPSNGQAHLPAFRYPPDSPAPGSLRPAVAPDAVSHAGRQYTSSQVRHAKPVIQLIQMIRSPKSMNTTHIARIPWFKIR